MRHSHIRMVDLHSTDCLYSMIVSIANNRHILLDVVIMYGP